MATLWATDFTTPLGPASVAVDADGAVKRFHFGTIEGLPRDDRAGAAVKHQVEEYFAGERKAFDLELAPEGTPFQQRVWQGLLSIPHGCILSYGELAARIGATNAFRAVGTANGANPIALIVPCHRVIGQDRSLTGYAGGVHLKAALLAHEGMLPQVVAANADRKTRVPVSPTLL